MMCQNNYGFICNRNTMPVISTSNITHLMVGDDDHAFKVHPVMQITGQGLLLYFSLLTYNVAPSIF